MNEFWGTMIGVACLVVLGLGTWGTTSFVYWCIEKRDRKKWDITVAQYPEVLNYQRDANAWWAEYDKKSDEANGYKKQIDALIGNLCYLPSYEVEWRTKQAEEYKVLYFEAKNEADKKYQLYRKAHDKVVEYCEEHKLNRWF